VTLLTGGCLCGALRYEITGGTGIAGLCYCGDCRKASGSGFIPFVGVARANVRFSGRAAQCRSISRSGREAVRNFCAVCHSLVFGGELDESDRFTIYAGSLDDPSAFRPTIAIFVRDRPAWAPVPPGLTLFDALPA
jgi:hypothetical protein